MQTTTRPFSSTALLAALGLLLPASALHAQFSWTDEAGKHLELRHGDKPVARYVYEAIDESSPERREATFKPFCHLYFHKWGHYGELLTKGPGGKFTHHRGVFYGFSRISYTEPAGERREKVDTWHCRKAHQIHRRFASTEAGSDSAAFASEIDWIGDDGAVFASEVRTMRFSFADADLVVDFESVLSTKFPEVLLDGDPQHAGFHFRAHNDVAEKSENATYFIRPGSGIGQPGATVNWSEKTDDERTRDLPWKAMCFTLRDTQTTIVYLDHPENPKPARASERQYGRFGTYFVATVTPERPLRARYRLVVRPGEYESANELAKLYKAWTGER